MKCPVVKRYLLRLENPERPCQAVRDHLSRCAACHAVQEGLLQLENEVRLMPFPESAAKARLLRQFQGGTLSPAAASSNGWLPWQVRERARRKLALAASLAAAILIFAVAWVIVLHQRGGKPLPADNVPSVVADQRRHLETELSQATAPAERLGVYVTRSRELLEAAAAASDEDAAHLVRFYRDEFLKNLLDEARQVPSADRGEMLTSLADKLDATAKEAQYKASYIKGDKAEHLLTLAAAAEKGSEEVRKLIV